MKMAMLQRAVTFTMYGFGSGNDAEIKAKDPLPTFIEWTLNSSARATDSPKTQNQDDEEDQTILKKKMMMTVREDERAVLMKREQP
jgi:hypothetical protein